MLGTVGGISGNADDNPCLHNADNLRGSIPAPLSHGMRPITQCTNDSEQPVRCALRNITERDRSSGVNNTEKDGIANDCWQRILATPAGYTLCSMSSPVSLGAGGKHPKMRDVSELRE